MFFGDVIQKNPIYNFCQGFKDIPADNNYKQLVLLENRPANFNETLKNKTALDEREKQLFTALNNLWTITKNSSGHLNCNTPKSPEMVKMEKDFEDGWGLIVCTTPSTPQTSGEGSIMPRNPSQKHYQYDYNWHYKDCEDKFGVNIDNGRNWFFEEFGGQNPKEDFKNYSNVITVNGALDPWITGCLQEQVNENMPVLTIVNGTHHNDQYLPMPDDLKGPGSVTEVRAQIMSYMEKWMREYKNEQKTVKGFMAQIQAQQSVLADQRYHLNKKPFKVDENIKMPSAKEAVEKQLALADKLNARW